MKYFLLLCLFSVSSLLFAQSEAQMRHSSLSLQLRYSFNAASLTGILYEYSMGQTDAPKVIIRTGLMAELQPENAFEDPTFRLYIPFSIGLENRSKAFGWDLILGVDGLFRIGGEHPGIVPLPMIGGGARWVAANGIFARLGPQASFIIEDARVFGACELSVGWKI